VDSTWFRNVEQANEFVTLMDASDRLVYVNHPQPGCDSYIGRSVFDYVDSTYHDVLRSALQRARETGLPQNYESDASGPNGETCYSNWVYSLPDEGIVAFVATDITHRSRVDAGLELSETTLRSLIENSPDTILVVDRKREILFINRDEVRFGSDRILGKAAELFVPELERFKVVDAIESVFENGLPTQYDTEVAAPTGSIRRYTTRLAPIARGGHIDRVMMVATDITDRFEAEQERERLAAQLKQAQKIEGLGLLTGGVHVEADQRAPSEQIDDFARGNNELILLVEDDPAVRTSLAVILQVIGYRTEIAENADTAIMLLRTKPEIELVLSDVVLRGSINGFELAARARSEYPGLPILLMSGYPERVIKQNRDSLSITVLEKPHTLEQLASAVRDSLRRKQVPPNF
jgi:PAS domain S-box-containing protein